MESVRSAMPLQGPLRDRVGPTAEEQEDIFMPDRPMDRVVRYPQVKEDAEGGYTPFLRAMRDRIRRKFR